MSGKHIRKEPICLNCQQTVEHRFCGYCGQENIEPRENFFNLLVHFFNDFTHFDGKFFQTIRVLLFQPGKLTLQYISGKRASFLHPVRMYFFISFAFFLFLFLSGDQETSLDKKGIPTKDAVIKKLNTQIDTLKKNSIAADTGIAGFVAREKILHLEKKKWLLEADSSKVAEVWNNMSENISFKINDSAISLVSPEWYELEQKKLPPNKQDGKVKHWLKKKIANANGLWQSGNNLENFFKESLLSLFPKLMFVSLPLFAFLLYILYRRKRIWGYTEHAILTLHMYSASYIILLISFLFTNIANALNWEKLSFIIGLIFTLVNISYYYFSLKNFYGQSTLKTIVKTVLIFFGSFLIFIFLFTFAIFFTFVKLH
ncbi:MAG: DUF3667 domain-containing protein [Chitinophagia bacterium]|jgi:hypothetical protein